MALNREIKVHQEWLGMVQPVGLVVSPAARVRAEMYPTHPIIEQQQGPVPVVSGLTAPITSLSSPLRFLAAMNRQP
jgi:hypothetical protein